jgi:hypothetical protein
MGIYDRSANGSITQKSETSVQQYIRLKSSQQGVRLWRNNNGAAYDINGRMIRYGLANDSAALSKKIKSSDLIGITPRLIQPGDVGHTYGIFTSVEVKRGDWKYTANTREQAQYAWIQLVVSMGGIGKFSTGVEYE